jgi:asparagine synthase (glutamine-hydrolysing)
MSMAVSLEARVPLLDHHLVEFAQSIPASLKLRDGVGKWIYREAVRGLVPDSVFSRPKKGFSVPLDRWLREDLSYRTEMLLRPDNPAGEFLDPSAVGRVLREHRVGRRDHSALIWRMLVLSLWMEGLRTPTRQRDLGALVADFVSGGA